MPPAPFRAEITRTDDAFMQMHAVVVPPDVAAAVLGAGSRRVLVTIAGETLRRALQTRIDEDGGRSHLVMISAAVLHDFGLREGVFLTLSVAPDPDPDRIDIPDELLVALDLDPEASARFETFTPGRQRSMAHYVSSAKRPETREKRALDLATKLRTYTLYGDTRTGG